MARREARAMKTVLWFLVVVTFIVALAIPAVYFYTKAQLPDIGSELELYNLLKNSVEAERRNQVLSQVTMVKRDITFQRPDLSNYPKHYVSLNLNERGCPRFFQSPREEGFTWARRMVAFFLKQETSGNDGWCEKIFAWNVAERVGATTHSQQVVATHLIHRALTKDALLAFDLATVPADTGVVGVEDAAQALLGKPLKEMSLAELAELALALPPHSYWDEVKECRNVVLLRQNRDVLIQHLRQSGLIPEDLSRNAQTEPLACAKRN